MADVQQLQGLVERKLAAFDRLEPQFETGFRCVQDVQGGKRFAEFPIKLTVEYLHSLWVCDCKDRLLSVPRMADRYEGEQCLALLRQWQAGESAGVVAFLQHKLDAISFGDITLQLEQAKRIAQDSVVTSRLAQGAVVMLNRGFNLHHALEPIFTLPDDVLMAQVRLACERFGHSTSQIDEQVRALADPEYTFVRHPLLARRNMVLMDRIGLRLTTDAADTIGHRTWRVATSATQSGPYAEEKIVGYVALTAPLHNNPADVRFVDRFEVFKPQPVRP